MSKENMGSYFQVAICQRAPEASANDVVEIAQELQRWVSRQPGFVGRRLIASENNTYVDIIEWVDSAAAEAAARATDHPDHAKMSRALALDGMAMHQGSAVSLLP